MKVVEVIGNNSTSLPKQVGFVPFISDGRCLFQGGQVPEIAKAPVDGDQDGKKVAASVIGARFFANASANMAASPFLGWSGTINGSKHEYELDVYAVLVKDADTIEGQWLTSSEFTTKAPKAQAQIMAKVFDKIEVYLKK